ncbi:AAA family ATPase [Streptomyces sp. NPDC016640]|uniref:AAA family ATPase n=1 Tax=Streptomyces sp. NPDC016640 TaxID=3364969 RepID=UPI003701C7E0
MGEPDDRENTAPGEQRRAPGRPRAHALPAAGLLLLERDREQALLSAVIGELGAGRPALVTVTGEPGAGQNELLRWAARHATERGIRVLTARATPAEQDLRYGVVGQLLAGHQAFTDHLPHLFLDRDRPGRFPGLTRLLGAARERPTLLVVEDVHRLDPDSLRWLEALARRLPHAPLALLTGRTCTADAGPDWWAGSPLTGSATTVELALPGLTRTGTGTAVRAVCGTVGDRSFVDAVVDATGGNPTVVGDTLRRFTRAGHTPDADHVHHVRVIAAEVTGELAASALGSLRDPVVLDVLRALAVCGDLLDFPLVVALAGSGAVPETRLRAALLDSGLVAVSDGRFRVSGPVVRDRIVEEMPAAERADLHARAAELAHRAAADDQGIGDLLLRARPVGAAWAVDTLCRAAGAALRGGDRDRAAAYLSRALDEPLPPRTRVRVQLQLAGTELVIAPVAAGRRIHGIMREPAEEYAAHRSRAADLCLLGGDTDTAWRALAECLAEDGPAGSGELPQEPGAAQEAAARHEELTALLRVAQPLRRTFAEIAVPPAPEPPRAPLTPAASGVRAWEAAARGADREEARRLARAALGPHPAGWPPLTVPRLLACRTLLLTEDLDDAETHLCALLTEAHRERRSVTVARVLALRAQLHLRQGRPDLAARDLSAADLELPPDSRHPLSYPYWTALGVVTDLANGRTDRARAAAERPVPPPAEESVTGAHLLYARGLLAEADGDPHRAAALFRACGRWLLQYGCVNPALLPWRSRAAEAAHALGDAAQALKPAREELELAERWGAPGAIGAAQFSLAMMSGEDRVQRLRSAVEHLGRAPDRAAYTRAVVALASAGNGAQPERVTALAPPAYGTAGTGVPSAGHHAVVALHSPVPAPAPAPVRPGPLPPVWPSLSPGERAAAVLAARGLANREIAAALSVTTRTVELRLSSVYRKLRIRGRDELRALAQGTEDD